MIDNTLINCETTEEHNHLYTPADEPSLSLGHHSSSTQMGQPVPNQPVQGISGAQYAPMNTDPTPPQTPEQSNIRINLAMQQVTRAMENLVHALRTAENPQANLEEAVSTALEQADWFRARLSDEVVDAIDDHDFDYEIGNHIERYMRNSFDPNDHVDFNDLVNDRVDDVIEDLVKDAVDRHLEEYLPRLIEEQLTNATIRIEL